MGLDGRAFIVKDTWELPPFYQTDFFITGELTNGIEIVDDEFWYSNSILVYRWMKALAHLYTFDKNAPFNNVAIRLIPSTLRSLRHDIRCRWIGRFADKRGSAYQTYAYFKEHEAEQVLRFCDDGATYLAEHPESAMYYLADF